MKSDKTKVFVGGISKETTEDALKEHFSKYGDVLESVIARDRNTGTPRGFGFVSFNDTNSADKALGDNHVILGRTVDVKIAVPRREQHQNHQQQQQHQQNNKEASGVSSNSSGHSFKTKKIFVGGLAASLSEEDFKTYFEKFGSINDVVVMRDRTTHRPRGFGFITFNSEESVDNVMQNNFHELNGRSVEVKRAIPKEESSNSDRVHNMKVGSGSAYANNFSINTYPISNPRYEALPGHGSYMGYSAVGGYLYGTNVFGGGYPVRYGGFGYGVSMMAPGGPWNGPTTIGVGSMVPYGNSYGYPVFTNSSFGTNDSAFSGFNSYGVKVNGKADEVVDHNVRQQSNLALLQVERGDNLGADSSRSEGSNGIAPSEQI